MAKYHFNLRTGNHVDHDAEGMDLQSLADAREEALLGARGIVAEAARTGEVSMGRAFEITDDVGEHLLTVGFDEAVRLI